MATSLDKSKLLEEEEEESFEHVDNLFEEEYEELKGRSNADYLPLEKGEILLRKGGLNLFVSTSVVVARLLRKGLSEFMSG